MYLIGNYHVELAPVLKRLGVPFAPEHMLALFEPSHNDSVPLLLSSSGYFHGDSRVLAKRLAKKGIRPQVLVVYDQHDDFNPSIKNDLLFEIIEIDAKHDFKKEARKLLDAKYDSSLRDLGVLKLHKLRRCFADAKISFSRHVYEAYRSGQYEEIYLLGVEPGWEKRVYDLITVFHQMGEATATKVIVSSSVWGAKDLRGKTLHVSSDTDVIAGTPIVVPEWRRTEGPSLDELCEAQRDLVKYNTLLAADICGYVGGTEPALVSIAAVTYGRLGAALGAAMPYGARLLSESFAAPSRAAHPPSPS